MGYRDARLRRLNEEPLVRKAPCVLYWCQAARRLERNHALDYALACARELCRPLVVLETLSLAGEWTSPRTHRFVLDGMLDNAEAAERRGFAYWPLVETRKGEIARGVEAAARLAAVVVTDEHSIPPVPAATAHLARRVAVPVFAVDSSALVPLALLGEPAAAAAHFRPRLHRAIPGAWSYRSRKDPRLEDAPPAPDPPFEPTDLRLAGRLVETLRLAAPVPPVEGVRGGTRAARRRLRDFLGHRLEGYAENRSIPRSPAEGHASGLSAYLSHGHISIEEVIEAALGDWTPDALIFEARGKRSGFWGADLDVEAFLDEALTWRDLGHHWHRTRHDDAARLETALPRWALDTLRGHAGDPRPYVYRLDAWERAQTHDPLWNAAQRELVATGTMHNYMRMLWGKKVLEWSASPEEAYATLVLLNNRYALDGCDPNSWTGILWCFGLFDRPWPPTRAVFGSVRYMSSANTARKFPLAPYLAYVDSLPPPAAVMALRRSPSPRASTER